MENNDTGREQQIWQRVRSGREELQLRDLHQLQREAMELAAIYRALSARMTGRQQEQLRKLYRGEMDNAAALGGIGILSLQSGETVKMWQPEQETSRKLLERCYHRTRRSMTEYLARSAEGEFGVVYEKMARREGEHCLILVQLLGSLR